MAQHLLMALGLGVVTTLTLLMASAIVLTDAPTPEIELPDHQNRTVRWVLRGMMVVVALGMAALMLKTVEYVSDHTDNGLHIMYSVVMGLLIFSVNNTLKGRRRRRYVTVSLFALVAAWVVVPNWITSNLLALALTVCVAVIYQLRSSFWRVVTLFAIAVCTYDMIQVYLSHDMDKAATAIMGSYVPVMVSTPASLHLDAAAVGGIGLGDLALSVVLIVMAGRIAQYTRYRPIFYGAVVGYIVGFAVAFLVVLTTGATQPATIYLLPAIALGVFVPASRRGLRPVLRRRIKDFEEPVAA